MKKVPKGKLVIIGGAANKGEESGTDMDGKNKDFEQYEILKELVSGQRATLEIITTASNVPEDVVTTYKKAFDKIGYRKVGFINVCNSCDDEDPEFIKRIEKAHTVMFSGGDQFRLSTLLGNTKVLEAIKSRYLEDADFIVAGTSAGAMAISSLMIVEGEVNEALLKGKVQTSSGLGFIDGCIIDTHFIKRGRFGRLVQAVVMNPSCIGVGLGEDTAMIIHKGNEAECIGSGMVVIIDSKHIRHTNIAYVEQDRPICIEDLKVHILCKGNKYMLNKREFLPSPEDLKIENKAQMEL